MRDVQHKSSTLKSVLESEEMFMLQQFKADLHPRTSTLGTWVNARHGMKIVSETLVYVYAFTDCFL